MKENKPFKKLTYRLAVMAKCKQCCCGSPKEVKECTVTECALYSFRLGKTPKPPVNALDLLIFPDDPNSNIFRIRDNSDDEEDIFEEDDDVE